MVYFKTSDTCDAYMNLAQDELFLNSLRREDVMLYLYINSASVIIGRNQNPWTECNMNRLDADGVRLVRRISGGGAVYHDTGNLNYSFICGEEIYNEARQTGVIQAALKEFNIKADVNGRNDLTVNGRKFSGNAFCKRKGMWQQHGTLLINSDTEVFGRYLNVSKQKLEAKGVKSVKARVCNLNEFSNTITVEGTSKALKHAFECEYGAANEYILSTENKAELDALYKKQTGFDWRIGETPHFDITIQNRYSWGMGELCLSVEHGIVSAVRLYTDALDTALSEKCETLLSGLPYKTEEIIAALNETNETKEIAEYIRINGI